MTDRKKDRNPREKIENNQKSINHTIMVMSGKGGVGKTTVAVSLAAALAKNKKVGILDTDINGPNVPKMLGCDDQRPTADNESIQPVTAKNGIKVMSMAFLLQSPDTPVIWRGPLKMQAIEQFLGDVAWGSLDYLVIDLPPGTGDEPLSIAQLIPGIDGAVIVTTPQDVALLDSRKAINFARELSIPVLGIVENMSGYTCPHCGASTDLFKRGGGQTAAQELDAPYLGAIPLDPAVVQAGDTGTPITLQDNTTPAAKAFETITHHIADTIKNPKK